MTTTIIEKLIIMHDLTKSELSECMEISIKSLENKLKYAEEWEAQDIKEIAKIFKLKEWQLKILFFTGKLSDTENKMRKAWIKSINYLINCN